MVLNPIQKAKREFLARALMDLLVVKRAYANGQRRAQRQGKGPQACIDAGRTAAIKASNYVRRQRANNGRGR